MLNTFYQVTTKNTIVHRVGFAANAGRNEPVVFTWIDRIVRIRNFILCILSIDVTWCLRLSACN